MTYPDLIETIAGQYRRDGLVSLLALYADLGYEITPEERYDDARLEELKFDCLLTVAQRAFVTGWEAAKSGQ